MSSRRYAIPTLQALGVTLGAAACTPSIMGSWELVELDGDDTTYTYTSGSCTITSTIDVTVDMDEKDGDKVLGSFETSYSASFSGCQDYGYDDGTYDGESYDGDVEASSDDGEEWDVEIEVEDGDDFDLTCTVDGDEMECEDEDGDELLFERG